MQSVEPPRLPWGSGRCASPGADLRWGGGGCTLKPYPWPPVQCTVQEALSSKTRCQNPCGLWCASQFQPYAAPSPCSSLACQRKAPHRGGLRLSEIYPGLRHRGICWSPLGEACVWWFYPWWALCPRGRGAEITGSGGAVHSRTDIKGPNLLTASRARPLARSLQALWHHVLFLRGSELVLLSVTAQGMNKASPTRQVMSHTLGGD